MYIKLMKKVILILLLFQSLSAAAQIRISDFKAAPGAADPRTSVQDPDGQPCAAIRLETRLSGWTFDAGLAGIMDTRQEDGAIWIYIPASARNLTVAHKDYAPLREWSIPLTLQPGGCYMAQLSYTEPRPAVSRKPAEATVPGLRSMPQKHFSQHFTDVFVGFCCERLEENYFEWDETCRVGFSYTWIGNRVGPYLSGAYDFDEGYSVVGGVALRLTDPALASLDWQLYGGAGLMDGSLGFDIGTRFGWRSTHQVSHWDFGLGCQFFQGVIMPTVSVGLCIWGIPTVVCLGLAVSAI